MQDFGNAFSTYVAQNYGANRPDRIKRDPQCRADKRGVLHRRHQRAGLRLCPAQQGFSSTRLRRDHRGGVQYLRIEGACYIGIGVLFLLYGYYRAVNQPGMSVILTIASLAPVWRWPICFLPHRWALPASGSVCPSAGHWQMPSALGII